MSVLTHPHIFHGVSSQSSQRCQVCAFHTTKIIFDQKTREDYLHIDENKGKRKFDGMSNPLNERSIQTQDEDKASFMKYKLGHKETENHNKVFWHQFGEHHRHNQDVKETSIVNNLSSGNETENHNKVFWHQFGEHHRHNQDIKETDTINSILSGKPGFNLSHVNAAGEARMVDVSDKRITKREAVARAKVLLGDVAYQLVRENKMKKGDVLGIARVAGIMAAKKTSELIPLCHPLSLSKIDVLLDLEERDEYDNCYLVNIEARAVTVGQTGVEMEALTAASVAALTVYDMCKAVTHNIIIKRIHLVSKSGGKKDYQFHR